MIDCLGEYGQLVGDCAPTMYMLRDRIMRRLRRAANGGDLPEQFVENIRPDKGLRLNFEGWVVVDGQRRFVSKPGSSSVDDENAGGAKHRRHESRRLRK